MSTHGPRLTISSDAHNVSVARSFVTAALAVLDVDEADRDKAKLVTSELVTQLVGVPAVEAVVVEIVETPEPTITIGSDQNLPDLPDDVIHILAALTGIRVDTGTRSWNVTFGRQ